METSKNVSKSIFYIIMILIMIMTSVVVFPTKTLAASYTQTVKSGIDAFPDDYKALLKKFIEETGHTNWKFQAYYTGINWNTLVEKESAHRKNRIEQSMDTIYRASCNNRESGYYCADGKITSYFMDPRNFINEKNIFQFIEMSYEQDIYTKDIIAKMVKKYKVFNYGNSITFVMSDEKHPDYNKKVTMTYTDIIMEAAKKADMSPINIVTKIIQEVGANGSGSTNGTHSKYPNCYNFFNIGANDEGDAIENGLKYADNAGWHCPYTSIVEGAQYNAKYYVAEGQNTAYFYKFDTVGSKILRPGQSQTVSDSELFSHQYMTNIQDPYSQSVQLFNTYTNNDLLDQNLTFIIPIYNNMPKVVEKPSSIKNTEQDLYYANVMSSVNTRKGPSTSYGNVTVEYTNASGNTVSTSLILYKDDLVVMLKRNAEYNNGMWWDKVKFWNGKEGYVASEYLSKFKSQETTPEPEPPITNTEDVKQIGYATITSSLNIRNGADITYKVIGSLLPKEEVRITGESGEWYKIKLENNTLGYVAKKHIQILASAKIEGDYIKTIPSAVATTIANDLNIKDYKIMNNNQEVTNGKLATGYKVVISGKEYTVLKLGDVNGDGEVNTGDAIVIQRHISELKNINGVYLKASNVNNDSETNTGDAIFVKRKVVGLQLITL